MYLQILKVLFPTGTSEAEADFLLNAFVDPDDYPNIISPPAKYPRLLIGRKGSGKSMIIQALEQRCANAGVPALLLKPDAFAFNLDSSVRDIATIKASAYAALLCAISTKIGSQFTGLLTGDEAFLLNQAVAAGDRQPDFVGRALKVLLPLGRVATDINLNAFMPEHNPKGKRLRELMNKTLERWGKFFYLLLDDTDQIAAPGSPDQLNRIWGFILAATRLCGELPNLKCIITIRSEVWSRLERDSAGNRDQIDHYRLARYQLFPSSSDMKEILRIRLALARSMAQEGGAPDEGDLFFKSTSVQLPSSSETRTWEDFIVKSSRERPRDVIQLVGRLAVRAIELGKPLIDSQVVSQVATPFSEDCVGDLKLELGDECPAIEEIIRSFSNLPFELKASETKSHLLNLPGAFKIIIRGSTLSPDNKDHLFLLWRLLHECGFLNPRTADVREKKNFRHVMFREDPDLVSAARWADVEKYSWEIHPAYRSFLMKNRDDEAARILGITLKSKRSKRGANVSNKRST